MRLDTLIRRVERVKEEVALMVRQACEKEEKTIVTMNRLALLSGRNVEYELMNNGIYSPRYERYKRRMGLYTGVVDLSLTGEMQDGMYVEYSATGFSVKTSDWKQWMVDYTQETGSWPSASKPHYGQVFGLSKNDRAHLAWKIKPAIVRGLRRKLLD